MAITKASGQAVAPAAKGDLVVGSATNDAAVLGVGSADQVLTVDSSTATGLKWATPSSGGITQIASTTAATNTVTFSSISGSYQHLMLIINNYLPINSNSNLYMRFNSSSTGYINNNSYGSLGDVPATETQIELTDGIRNSSANGAIYVFIPNYASTTAPKILNSYGFFQSNITAGRLSAKTSTAFWNNTAAVTSLTFTSAGGNMTSGVFTLYGVK